MPRTTTRIEGDVDEWLRANVAPGTKYKLIRDRLGHVYFDPIFQGPPEPSPEPSVDLWGKSLANSAEAIWGRSGGSGRAICRRVGETDAELRERAIWEYWDGEQWVEMAEQERADDAGQICPDCRGSKTYVGLRERRDCPTCGGSGMVKEDDDDHSTNGDRR